MVVRHTVIAGRRPVDHHGSAADRRASRNAKEENVSKATSITLLILMAVALAASNAMGADRMVVVEHFTATW
jgi:hypothetical protein